LTEKAKIGLSPEVAALYYDDQVLKRKT